MILRPQRDAPHDEMLGRNSKNPVLAKFHHDDILPPAKRLKTFESNDGKEPQYVSGDESVLGTPNRYHDGVPDSEDEIGLDDDTHLKPTRPTELESASLPVKTDRDAIAEYEAMRASEDYVLEDLKARLSQRSWREKKSSIYVDAFNLALETVLDDEKHLFDEKEMEVFNQWRELEYEAQYL
jgi:Fanconi-associated nuclease 1